MTASRTIPISGECRGAVDLDLPGEHRRCAGNEAVYLPAVAGPVLPKTKCGCACHKTTSANR